MIFQEKFEVTQANQSYFSKQFDILITGMRNVDDKRHNNLKELLYDYEGLIFSLDTCENTEKLHYIIEDSSGNIIENDNAKILIPDLQILLRKNNFQGANVCIDITTLKQGILFLLVKILVKSILPSKLFAAYTEPTEYKKRELFEIGETEEFDLYETIIGSSNGVPGFTKHEGSRDKLLIAPMGFDSQRLQVIYESLKPKLVIPVVGFPSFVPGWNLTAVKMNYLILKNADCFDMIETCEAASPFELYEFLEKLFHRYTSNYDVYISPIGTRPHCLGAALFVTKFPSTYLVYDFPIEKQFRSENILKANIYHLSKFIG